MPVLLDRHINPDLSQAAVTVSRDCLASWPFEDFHPNEGRPRALERTSVKGA